MKKLLFVLSALALLAVGYGLFRWTFKQTAVPIPVVQETKPASAVLVTNNNTVSQYPRTMQYYVDNYNFENSDTTEMLNTTARSNLVYFINNIIPSLSDKDDAQLIVWWVDIEGILGRNPWAFSNCLDKYSGPGVDCLSKGGYKSGNWQVGYGVQVYYDASNNFSSLQSVFNSIYPGNTPKEIGDNVLKQAGQDGMVYPDSLTLDEIIKNPSANTNSMSNAYWGSVLMRDLKISARLEAPIVTAWTCYGKNNGQVVTIPKWCASYTALIKTHSKSMKIIINTWNDIINKGS